MTIDNVKALDNVALLDLFQLMVRTDHYDPTVTPAQVVELRKEGVRTEDLEALVLARMSGV